MKSLSLRVAVATALTLSAAALLTRPGPMPAQAQEPLPFGPPVAVSTTPTSQRNALNNVRSRITWLQNATRTAPNYATGGFEIVSQQFRYLRASFEAFEMTLNPWQRTNGANEIAELEAGLDILEEALGNYQGDVAAGRQPYLALRDMCKVLRDGADVWVKQLNKNSSTLRVGW